MKGEMQAEPPPFQEKLICTRKGFLPLENYLKFNLHSAFFFLTRNIPVVFTKKEKKRITDNISKFGHLKLTYFQGWLSC